MKLNYTTNFQFGALYSIATPTLPLQASPTMYLGNICFCFNISYSLTHRNTNSQKHGYTVYAVYIKNTFEKTFCVNYSCLLVFVWMKEWCVSSYLCMCVCKILLNSPFFWQVRPQSSKPWLCMSVNSSQFIRINDFLFVGPLSWRLMSFQDPNGVWLYHDHSIKTYIYETGVHSGMTFQISLRSLSAFRLWEKTYLYWHWVIGFVPDCRAGVCLIFWGRTEQKLRFCGAGQRGQEGSLW